MAKDLKKAISESTDIFDIIATTNTQNTSDTEDTPSTKKEFYRFNLKMPIEYKDHLQSAAYHASTPHKTVTITEYICELIKADMQNNPQGGASDE